MITLNFRKIVLFLLFNGSGGPWAMLDGLKIQISFGTLRELHSSKSAKTYFFIFSISLINLSQTVWGLQAIYFVHVFFAGIDIIIIRPIWCPVMALRHTLLYKSSIDHRCAHRLVDFYFLDFLKNGCFSLIVRFQGSHGYFRPIGHAKKSWYTYFQLRNSVLDQFGDHRFGGPKMRTSTPCFFFRRNIRCS